VPTLRLVAPDIRSIAKFLAAYGAGVVTAGYFLSGPGEYPAGPRVSDPVGPPAYQRHDQEPHAQPRESAGEAARQASPLDEDARALSNTGPAPERQGPGERPRAVREIPIERPSRAETTGAGEIWRDTARAPAPDASDDRSAGGGDCNVAVCQTHYRSFDPRTCTYRSFEGEIRRCVK
jgi:hypothetical protein